MPDLEQQSRDVHASDNCHDGRTPLDRTIDRIGMGSYQWTLLSLCGFGWMADNMWIQAIAIILPRVQQHYSVPDSYIGALSSSMFAGMMFGAIGWGTCSDLLGRSAAFNATLFFTALFGLVASFANSFTTLCVTLFFLGSAVGGSMPTDGTLLLEHMPKEKQYLVTALSVFFSFGAVLSAVVALIVVPKNSCPPSPLPCNPELQNKGWQYLLISLGLITLSMFLARMVFFRLHESPRYLVHAGRPHEAVKSLQMISRFNGSDLSIELGDVIDHHHPVSEGETSQLHVDKDVARVANGDGQSAPLAIAGKSGHEEVDETSPLGSPPRGSSPNASGSTLVADYHATRENPTPLDRVESGEIPHSESSKTIEDVEEENDDKEDAPLNPERTEQVQSRVRQPTDRSRARVSFASTFSRKSEKTASRLISVLPRWLADPLCAWMDRVWMVLSPEWLRTTLLVWAAWCAMSLAYTMFNVFLPKLLESGSSSLSLVAKPKSIEDSLWDVVVFTIGGCPGAILGAYLIESRLGRRWSLAGSTFLTALLCLVFVRVHTTLAVRLTTVGISLSATTMWAVLYGWTPEIFGTKVRGTACGIASALSRIGGMVAPLVGGMLLVIDRSIPVYTSAVTFVIAGLCVLLLKEDNSPRKRNERLVVH
ncbi:hypothetical protein AMATHDRAFT_62131 [Amanita thiersii Skay4041]|uniref:Major facilitator superfamily (MFS) profile domain-containing protein n=1 Tax=Amanita thiersii Skay4041 TaxID=703135 RepID=A0A2A9NQK2_9AGAR|nr:hypothetical protein AMATHDRAFT_62131 [Amanita thiersii Skay4041]